MNCKFTIPFILFIAMITSNGLYSQVLIPSKGSENVISLNGIWKFKYIPSSNVGADSVFNNLNFDASGWATIKTPGHWELQGFAEPFYGSGLKEGTGLYRTNFKVPSDWKGGRVYIAFDGVQYGYDFWVNGKYAGSFASSFNRAVYDISSFVVPGKENVLAVKVSTRVKGWEFDIHDCWALSGIIRDVTLFGLPPVHIKDLTIKTQVGTKTASVSVNSIIESSVKQWPKDLNVIAQITGPDGKIVKDFALTSLSKVSKTDTISFSRKITVDNPKLWTAETPFLYTIKLSININKKEVQKYTEHFGIREISWSNGILRLNGSPIKLRGVDHHDLSPVNGRSMTEEEMKQDLILIQKANINFIRTSHYPPQPRLLELCDSMGFYVMDEVPFGFGEEHLNDASYLPLLKMRAKSTVWRDKNHPSVIVWSVGNENPLTDICLQTGKYVKSLDNTRPYCFPQTGYYFNEISHKFPDSIDILAPHYPSIAKLHEYSNKFNRPMIVTEYAHSLGLDFDTMDSLWEIMYTSPKLAGGAVWDFADQGILRKSSKKISKDEVTTSAWLDSVTIYDNHDNLGADGIVYANRIPQVDYWQVRKVYSPVKAFDDAFMYKPGKQTINILVMNRFDFINLKEVTCKWQLYSDRVELSSGFVPLNCLPHDTLSIPILLNLPEKTNAHYHYLKLTFSDKKNYQFYEKVFQIKREGSDLLKKMAENLPKPILKDGTVSSKQYTIEFSKEHNQMLLKNKKGVVLISNGPWFRAGRKSTMSQRANTYRSTRENAILWDPYLLSKPLSKEVSRASNNMVVNYKYEREYPRNQFISGNMEYTFSDSGFINIKYHLVPDSANGKTLEAGISFLIPSSLSEFRWVGKGPYPAYPGKDCLNDFGFFHINRDDINFQGNHSNVECAVFSDNKGNGFAIIAKNANISVERTPEGIVVSHNALLSGRFTKFSWPGILYSFENIKEISGSFTLVPLAEIWPDVLQNFFGNPYKTAIPFKPFFNSYDQ